MDDTICLVDADTINLFDADTIYLTCPTTPPTDTPGSKYQPSHHDRAYWDSEAERLAWERHRQALLREDDTLALIGVL
jgi:hypothetical protein